MARKFSGRFSPGEGATTGAPAGRATKKPRAMRRARLMFFAPLPLVFRGFSATTAGNVAGMVQDFGALVLLWLGAWLLREGLRAEVAFLARNHARRPAFPRKIFAAIIVGAGVALAVQSSAGLLAAGAIGLFGALLHLVAFGIDPLKSKGVGEAGDFAARRILRTVDEAEGHIATMTKTLALIGDRKLSAHLGALTTSAEAMIRDLQDDPRDLTAARKYLGVYLMGARDATQKFVGLYEKTRDRDARADYESLIDDLVKNFNAQRQALLANDRDDLDVEIDVLRDRLRYEGVKN